MRIFTANLWFVVAFILLVIGAVLTLNAIRNAYWVAISSFSVFLLASALDWWTTRSAEKRDRSESLAGLIASSVTLLLSLALYAWAPISRFYALAWCVVTGFIVFQLLTGRFDKRPTDGSSIKS